MPLTPVISVAVLSSSWPAQPSLPTPSLKPLRQPPPRCRRVLPPRRAGYCSEGLAPGVGRSPFEEDMTPSDTTINYKLSSFLLLHSDFWYNSLGSTCMYHYLLVDTNVPQSANPSKLKFQFVGVQTLLHCNEHNYFIWNAIEVNKHLMENLFDKLSNGSSLTSRLRWECL